MLHQTHVICRENILSNYLYKGKYLLAGLIFNMTLNFRLKILSGLLFAAVIAVASTAEAKSKGDSLFTSTGRGIALRDTTVPADIMNILTTVINSTNNFNIDAVANLYTPNAVVCDDDPPYSWNGPTAGVQWVNAVERACKQNSVSKLKGVIGAINVFQQSSDNAYVVVPVSYTGLLPGKQQFAVKGAFTFVLRRSDSKWLIKSQTWIQQKALAGE